MSPDVATRKGQERALRESEDRYRRILETANEGIWVLDVDWRTSFVNGRLAEMFGRSVDELLGMTPMELSFEEDIAQGRTGLPAISEAQAVTDLHRRYRRKDGTELCVVLARSALIDEDGGYFGSLVMVTDETQRRAAEVRFEGQRKQLVEAQSIAALGSWTSDVGAGTVSLSDELCRICGHSVGHGPRTFEDVLAIIHPDDQAVTVMHARAAVAARASFSLHFRVVRPDGLVRTVHTLGRMSEDAGPGIHLIGTTQDVTERERTEEALRASERQYRQILETTHDAFVAVDDVGIVTDWNARATAMFGWPSHEAIGRDFAEMIVPGRYRDRYRGSLKRFIDTGSSRLFGVEAELSALRRDGREFPIAFAATPLKTDLGWVFNAFIRDISTRKELARQRTRLEADLHQKQRLESVGQLAGGVAHDFNNILAVVQSYAELAASASEGQVHDDLEEIMRAAERGAQLTRQLLLFARHEPAIHEVLDLNEVVATTETMLRRTLGSHVVLDVVKSPATLRVTSDRGQLEQVLVNLAVNARDSMRDGGTLTIETSELPIGEGPTSLDPTARYASLTVTDTGEGMARDVCERAFEPFFTTKTPRNGTGLGLSTSHGIIKHAGGTIRIESPPGLGTIVTILLPATLEEPAEPAILPRPPARGNGQLVLVVDDNVAVRNATSRTLASHGYRVMCAHDGARALALCRGHGAAIDVLVSDLVMPVMAGSDLAIEAVALIPSLQVILMSGYADEHLPRPQASGAPEVLQKPFPAATLLRKVAELLAARDNGTPGVG